MDIPNLLACMIVSPWFFILTRFIVFADLLDLILLILFGYLLVLFDQAIRKEEGPLKIVRDEPQMKESFSQTTDHLYEEACTQRVQETSNAFTQVYKIKFIEKSTEAAVIAKDNFTQTKSKEFSPKFKETHSGNEQVMDARSSVRDSEKKESQTSSCLLSDKGIQTDLMPKTPSKVLVPMIKQKPKPTTPTTKKFLRYHKNKHTLKRKKIKFRPKLKTISEVQEDETDGKMYNVLFGDAFGISSSSVDKSSGIKYGCGKSILHEEDEKEQESELGKNLSPEELPFQASSVNKGFITPNSVSRAEDSCNDGHPFNVLSAVKTIETKYYFSKSFVEEVESDLDKMSSNEELKRGDITLSESITTMNVVEQSGDSSNDDYLVFVRDKTELVQKKKKGSFFKRKFRKLKKRLKK